jgi:two-component system response regulator CpxR
MGASTPRDRILVIDDDIELCELVIEYLTVEGFEVEPVHEGLKGVDTAVSGEFALVILDVMLPQINGFEVLRRIRAKARVPVLMLTARGDDVDRIVGLELGADDYLPKPFNPRELVARIHAILRRTRPAGAAADTRPERVTFEDLLLETGSRTSYLEGKALELTGVEFDLLYAFLTEPGTILKREDLVRRVLGRKLSPFDRSIDMHVSNLRKKLGPKGDGTERIKSIRGVGYLYTRASEPV